GGNDGGSFVAVARGDDLVEKIGTLLIERQIAKLVNDEQSGLSVDPQFADQRVIDLRSKQVVEHVHGGSEQHPMVRLTSAPTDDFGEKGFSHTGIADKDCPISLGDELQIEQPQNTRLQIHAALVVFELEAVD